MEGYVETGGCGCSFAFDGPAGPPRTGFSAEAVRGLGGRIAGELLLLTGGNLVKLEEPGSRTSLFIFPWAILDTDSVVAERAEPPLPQLERTCEESRSVDVLEEQQRDKSWGSQSWMDQQPVKGVLLKLQKLMVEWRCPQ
ncbi:hypothetical protein NDU88_008858 [Pleurodeles waltl]|uniref:Uncharacterized protein n=1 Tax=Pleurodeles waltl TaxID=8319 RepID=A0AAV7RTN3_PLEWA|nr:hypothetical protein NDU88_008858 [Pleurodeles waltl]